MPIRIKRRTRNWWKVRVIPEVSFLEAKLSHQPSPEVNFMRLVELLLLVDGNIGVFTY